MNSKVFLVLVVIWITFTSNSQTLSYGDKVDSWRFSCGYVEIKVYQDTRLWWGFYTDNGIIHTADGRLDTSQMDNPYPRLKRDSSGNIIMIGNYTRISRDRNGRVRMIDGPDSQVMISRDVNGRVRMIDKNPRGAQIMFSRDGNGRVSMVTNSKGNQIFIRRDSYGRLKQIGDMHIYYDKNGGFAGLTGKINCR